MKILLCALIPMAVSFVTCSANAADQQTISTDGTDPKSWDPKTDGPIAAAGNHKVIFEDDNIRIMSVTVLPGTREPYHSHLRCSVLVYDHPAQSTDYNIKGDVSARVALGSIAWQSGKVPKPLAFLQPPQAPHSIVNSDTHVLHLTRIELKNGCDAPPE